MLEAIDGLDPDLQQFVKDVIRSFARTATVEKVGGAASGLIDTIKSARPLLGSGAPGAEDEG